MIGLFLLNSAYAPIEYAIDQVAGESNVFSIFSVSIKSLGLFFLLLYTKFGVQNSLVVLVGWD